MRRCALSRVSGRFLPQLGLLLALIVGTGAFSRASAQVRPDTTKRDTTATKRDTTKRNTVRVAVPIPDPVRDSIRLDSARKAVPVGAIQPLLPKPGSPEDSVMQARIIARTDSIRKFKTGDTIRAPIARFERPPTYELDDERLRLDRKQILSSGSVNLADLLDRVPGITSFRSGWIAGLHAVSYNGDFSRIRIFVDGVELDPVEARNGGVLDLADIPLWTLDELLIERAPGEVRVWLRSWSYTKTIPFTRADIFTGDRNTNGFRGLFARRSSNGFILQLGAQQAATQTGTVSAFGPAGTTRNAGDGSQQVINTRIGWSKRQLTIDFYANASQRDRDAQTPRRNFAPLPAFKGSRRDAYLRVGFGDTSTGFWTQAVIAAVATRLNGLADTTAPSVVSDSDSVAVGKPDSLRSRTQQIFAIGYRGKGWQYSFVDRVRAINGRSLHSPVIRASIGSSRLGGGLYAERRGADSTTRIDLFTRVAPLKWLVFSVSQSLRRPSGDSLRPPTSTTRAEAGVRLGTLLFGGGIIREDTIAYLSPVLLAASGALLNAGPATGFMGSVHGRLFKDLYLDVQGMRWNTAQFGRPQLNVRTQLALISDWRSRFPKGEFSFNARLTYDRRGSVPFFYGLGADQIADIRSTVQANVVSGLVEIRIQRATLFYVYRNLTGGDYEQIPGLTMPPAVQMYGVRWEFFN